MILPLPSRFLFSSNIDCSSCRSPTNTTIIKPLNCVATNKHQSDSSADNSGTVGKTNGDSILSGRLCSCGRRHFVEAASATALLPLLPSSASDLKPVDRTVFNRVRSPRPDWYEEFFAYFMNSGTKAYEAEVATYKSQLFANLRGKAEKVLELGVGTGPNLKYYASNSDMQVFGVDPNSKMEKYAQEAAVEAHLPRENFKFVQAVGEAIPLSDASVDAVIGTLVLCSVKDVNQTLQEVKRVLKPGGLYLFVEHVAAKDGTIRRFLQSVLDPLQRKLGDGCHLTRETGKEISGAGFAGVDLSTAFVAKAYFVNPHVYGVARK